MFALHGVKYKLEQAYRSKPLTDSQLVDLVQRVFETANTLLRNSDTGWKNWPALVWFVFGEAHCCHRMSKAQYREAIQLIQLGLDAPDQGRWSNTRASTAEDTGITIGDLTGVAPAVSARPVMCISADNR
jgi:hypothetical protein